MERDPLFAHSNADMTLDQKREITFRRVKRLFEYEFLPTEEAMENPTKLLVFQIALQMYDMALYASYSLSRTVSIYI